MSIARRELILYVLGYTVEYPFASQFGIAPSVDQVQHDQAGRLAWQEIAGLVRPSQMLAGTSRWVFLLGALSTSWSLLAGDFFFRPFLFLGWLVESLGASSSRFAGWNASISSTSRVSKAFLMGVGAGGGQLVNVANFCGCCHASACCSGGSRSRGLSGSLTCSVFWVDCGGLYSFPAFLVALQFRCRCPSSPHFQQTPFFLMSVAAFWVFFNLSTSVVSCRRAWSNSPISDGFAWAARTWSSALS